MKHDDDMLASVFMEKIMKIAEHQPHRSIAEVLQMIENEKLGLPDFNDPEAFGQWIFDTQPKVMQYLPDKMINAIKEARAITKCSLYDAKYAVEHAMQLQNMKKSKDALAKKSLPDSATKGNFASGGIVKGNGIVITEGDFHYYPTVIDNPANFVSIKFKDV